MFSSKQGSLLAGLRFNYLCPQLVSAHTRGEAVMQKMDRSGQGRRGDKILPILCRSPLWVTSKNIGIHRSPTNNRA